MIDLINGIVLFVTGIISGMALHSLYLHAKKRKEIG